MKKYSAIFIACLLLFTGCGGDPPPDSESESSSSVDTVPESEDGSGNGASDVTLSSDNTDPSDEVVVITEKMFIAQCNDIYLNPNEYTGKIVRIEGIYDENTDEAGNTSRGVIRNGPGCCGNDGVAGFGFLCKDEGSPLCKQDDWVAVEGVITPYTYDDGYETIIIGDASVTVKAERGAEFVTQ
ncbi:MAG: hypothetical protein LBN35_04325 [Clostridiales Family XIII bacterium]|jgi:uncharacterized membrane protein YcgQ (UPF0703/DUF1980 family)|nr:hypothetical protein [Clostridiales Family XIII bacterium]